jgi:hypothetical protein
VILVRTDVSEENGVSIIRVSKIGELGNTLIITGSRRPLLKSYIGFSVLINPDFQQTKVTA